MNKKQVYVVVRAGRRIDPENYPTHALAQERATALRAMLKQWNDPDVSNVAIIPTPDPYKIR